MEDNHYVLLRELMSEFTDFLARHFLEYPLEFPIIYKSGMLNDYILYLWSEFLKKRKIDNDKYVLVFDLKNKYNDHTSRALDCYDGSVCVYGDEMCSDNFSFSCPLPECFMFMDLLCCDNTDNGQTTVGVCTPYVLQLDLKNDLYAFYVCDNDLIINPNDCKIFAYSLNENAQLDKVFVQSFSVNSVEEISKKFYKTITKKVYPAVIEKKKEERLDRKPKPNNLFPDGFFFYENLENRALKERNLREERFNFAMKQLSEIASGETEYVNNRRTYSLIRTAMNTVVEHSNWLEKDQMEDLLRKVFCSNSLSELLERFKPFISVCPENLKSILNTFSEKLCVRK